MLDGTAKHCLMPQRPQQKKNAGVAAYHTMQNTAQGEQKRCTYLVVWGCAAHLEGVQKAQRRTTEETYQQQKGR